MRCNVVSWKLVPTRTPANRGEETPLYWATSRDEWHVATPLIAGGADINAPNGLIVTPPATAVKCGCCDVAGLLVPAMLLSSNRGSRRRGRSRWSIRV